MSARTRVVLAVRIGKASGGPARTAVWLASRLDAEITLVYVATELRTAAEVAVGAGLNEEDVRRRMREEARSRAEEWARVSLEGRPFQVVVEEGDVGERVAAVAGEVGADLVVAGTEVRGGIRGMIAGDTTRDILRHSRCPVVVVPPLMEDDGGDGG